MRGAGLRLKVAGLGVQGLGFKAFYPPLHVRVIVVGHAAAAAAAAGAAAFVETPEIQNHKPQVLTFKP